MRSGKAKDGSSEADSQNWSRCPWDNEYSGNSRPRPLEVCALWMLMLSTPNADALWMLMSSIPYTGICKVVSGKASDRLADGMSKLWVFVNTSDAVRYELLVRWLIELDLVTVGEIVAGAVE